MGDSLCFLYAGPVGTPQEPRKEMVRDYHHLAPDEEVSGEGGAWAVQTSPRSQQGVDEACIQGLSQALQPFLYDLCSAEPCGRHGRSEPNQQGAADWSPNPKEGTSERKIPPMFPSQNRWVLV